MENPTSFRDLPLQWDGDGKIPDWLSGTYVKNGPAQVNNKIKSCILSLRRSHFVLYEDKFWEYSEDYDQLAGWLRKAS